MKKQVLDLQLLANQLLSDLDKGKLDLAPEFIVYSYFKSISDHYLNSVASNRQGEYNGKV